MLQGLSETCSQLKALDVNGSLRVTNVSVEYIKKFEHLTILNLRGTNINCEGERTILSHLSNSTPCPLEMYGCPDIDNNHFNTLLRLIPNIQELRTSSLRINEPSDQSLCHFGSSSGTQKSIRAAVGRKRTAGPAPRFDNLKILRIDYCDDSSFLGKLPKFVTHLQELEITGHCIRIATILERIPTLTKLFVRSYYLQHEFFRPETTFSSLQHLTLLTLTDKEAENIISRCQNLRKLELITHIQFYGRRQRILTQLPNLEEISLGALGGHVPPETAALLSGRFSTTILLEDTHFAYLYQHYPGVSVDTDRWLQITQPGLSELKVHTKYGR
jgi:hypothetical protein